MFLNIIIILIQHGKIRTKNEVKEVSILGKKRSPLAGIAKKLQGRLEVQTYRKVQGRYLS